LLPDTNAVKRTIKQKQVIGVAEYTNY